LPKFTIKTVLHSYLMAVYKVLKMSVLRMLLGKDRQTVMSSMTILKKPELLGKLAIPSQILMARRKKSQQSQKDLDGKTQ